ncbi:MAG: DUF5667 domain-containing protein [bacterium]
MTNKEILKKLKSVNEIIPNERWVSKNRSDLLLRIKESRPVCELNVWNRIFALLKLNFGFLLDMILPQRFVDNFARPLAVSFVGAMIVVGSISTIGISQNTTPGNILYPVKIIGENVQLSFTANVEDKARLEMEFAGRRIKELNKLVAENKLSSADLDEKVNKVALKLQNNIQTANVHLAELDQSGEAGKAMRVAKDIDKKVSEYTVALNKISGTAATKSKVAEALNQVEAVSDKALEVIVTKRKDSQDGISDSEIVEKLNNKIALTITDTGAGTDSKIENKELDQTIQDARDLIQTGDFAAALNKITEGKDIIKELRAKMEAQVQENNETQEQDEVKVEGAKDEK